jgi:hypothetical protein
MEILNWLSCWPSSKETLSRTFGNSPRIFREICRWEAETSVLEVIPFVHTKRRKKVAMERDAGPASELKTEIPGVNRS